MVDNLGMLVLRLVKQQKQQQTTPGDDFPFISLYLPPKNSLPKLSENKGNRLT